MKNFDNFISDCQNLNEFAGDSPATKPKVKPATKNANSIRKFNRTKPATTNVGGRFMDLIKKANPGQLANIGRSIVSVAGRANPYAIAASIIGSDIKNRSVTDATMTPDKPGYVGDATKAPKPGQITTQPGPMPAFKPKVDPVVEPKIKPVQPGDTPVEEPDTKPSPEVKPEVKPETKTKPGAIAALATGALGAAATKLSPRTQTQGQPQKPNGNNKTPTTGGEGGDNKKKRKPRPRFKLPKFSSKSSSDSGSSGSGGISGLRPNISQIS